MPRIRYVDYNPNRQTRALIRLCVEILDEFTAQGFLLTLRQLYYQLVARDHIPNTVQSYNRVGNVVSKARDAGMIDWNRIEDRTRSCNQRPHWEDGADFLSDVTNQFCLDLWQGQTTRCEVWVEKEALSQVVAKAATPLDVPYFANKGYVSSSSMWQAAHGRILKPYQRGHFEKYVILHLGDHDPSGMDMSRDIEDRLWRYSTPYHDTHRRPDIKVRRIALNMDQVDQYKPPPNPAKVTDSRIGGYMRLYGMDSWELDALDPNVIVDLISDVIKEYLDIPLFEARKEEELAIRGRLIQVADESF